MGQKGESWFALQAALMAAILFGRVPLLQLILKGLGSVGVVSGLYYFMYGALDLRESLTPFVFPVSKNALKTEGAFGLVRHPIYTGLILASFGLSLFTHSLTRFLLSIALFTLLVYSSYYILYMPIPVLITTTFP